MAKYSSLEKNLVVKPAAPAFTWQTDGLALLLSNFGK